ncbi:MAG: hypothetical protein QM278_09465 [Pseudomonadota bacterium]|nr:hypothetical protein [Pseudomonadota bacterium]
MTTKIGYYRQRGIELRFDPRPATPVESKRMNLADNIRYLVLETDWDKELIRRQTLIDGLCKGAAGLAALYFLPILLNIFWR